jgi:hypothetical protein
MGLASDRLIFDLPFEQVEAATVAGDLLWVLADDQLARVDLVSGALQTLAEIEVSDWGSHLLVPRGRPGVFYAAGVEDSSTLLGHATCVGYYDVQAKQARLLTKLPGGVIMLGSAVSGDTLYAVRMGGDGGFGTILTINLEDGTTSTEVELQRMGVEAVMSLDNRWVAVVDAKNWSQPKEQGCITLYSLVEPDSLPVSHDLPHEPSHARGIKWAPDSQHLYFVLWPGPLAGWSDQPQRQPYGLWQLDVLSGEMKEIAPSVRIDYYPLMVAPDGRAVLIGDEFSFTLIDVQTGAEGVLNLPPGSRILAWRVSE